VLSNSTSSTTKLLALVLGLLESLTRLLNPGEESITYKTMLGLELDHGLLVVVNEAESGGLSSSELGAESKDDYEFGVCLVHTSDDSLEFGFSYVSASGVDNVNNHL